jgi:hypothetical protein
MINDQNEDKLSSARSKPKILPAPTEFPDDRLRSFFNVCVYLKRRFGSEWQARFHHYNQIWFDPPLTAAEMSGTLEAVGQNNYSYTCEQTPLCDVCDRATCQTRKFGIGWER